jgi:hypothetical protein
VNEEMRQRTKKQMTFYTNLPDRVTDAAWDVEFLETLRSCGLNHDRHYMQE